MRSIYLARLDKTRPVVMLTREPTWRNMSSVTVASVTTTVRGLSVEVPVGPANGLDHESVVNCDNILSIPVGQLGRHVGHLDAGQERDLARAIGLAFGLSPDLG